MVGREAWFLRKARAPVWGTLREFKEAFSFHRLRFWWRSRWRSGRDLYQIAEARLVAVDSGQGDAVYVDWSVFSHCFSSWLFGKMTSIRNDCINKNRYEQALAVFVFGHGLADVGKDILFQGREVRAGDFDSRLFVGAGRVPRECHIQRVPASFGRNKRAGRSFF